MKRTIPKQKQRKRAHKIERVVRSIVSCCEVFRTHGGGATRLVRLLPPSTPSCSSDVIVAQRPPRWSFPFCSLVWSCSRQFGAMVLTCAVESCRTNYQANKVVVIPDKQSVFKFPNPVKRAELRSKWIRFCNHVRCLIFWRFCVDWPQFKDFWWRHQSYDVTPTSQRA